MNSIPPADEVKQLSIQTLKYANSLQGVERVMSNPNTLDLSSAKVVGSNDDCDELCAQKWESVNSVNKYKMGETIAEGGIGKVTLAYDKNIGRKIAFKELKGPHVEATPGVMDTNGEVNARFLREARVTGQLEHPSIIPVYEIGVKEEGDLYYTMRLIRGQTLETAIKLAGSLERRLLLLPHYLDLCNAIAYAHQKGVIHRDIKPGNIMIGEFGETLVIDWGLAKVLGEHDREGVRLARDIKLFQDGDPNVILAGAKLGTPAYMAPEQARGEIDLVDERSDIYGLGAVLYEILTGQTAHLGASPQDVLSHVINEPLMPPEERSPAAPRELCAICRKALHKDPALRHQSARSLVDEVEHYLAKKSLDTEHLTSTDLIGRLMRKSPMITGLGFLAILFLLLGSLYLATLIREANHKSAKAAEASTSCPCAVTENNPETLPWSKGDEVSADDPN